MKQIIQAVLFDLGDTLMHSPSDWAPVFEQAGKKLSDLLCNHDVEIDCETFHVDFRQRLDIYYAERERNLVETSTIKILEELLAEKGHTNIPEGLLRSALDEFYSVTQQNWILEDDAVSTLTTLHANGFHLGLVSNAGDNRDVFQLIKKFNIEEYFDFILTSAACGYRKPHPHIFELAISKWGYMPDEIAMVGDRLDADVGGARPLGMFSIWIKRRAKKTESLSSSTRVDAIVEKLSEIPALLLNSQHK